MRFYHLSLRDIAAMTYGQLTILHEDMIDILRTENRS